MTPEERANLEVLLDWLYMSEDSGWTCADCGWGNGGAYRLDCKGCNEGVHPMKDQIVALWLAIGRTYSDEDYGHLVPPATYSLGRQPAPPQRWREYLDKFGTGP
jgi:hypothetical protein